MAQPKDFGFGSEEQMLRDSARKFLKDNSPIEKLRALVAKDHKIAYESDVQPLAWDEQIWKQMVELGWTALAVPGVGRRRRHEDDRGRGARRGDRPRRAAVAADRDPDRDRGA